jgi:hypothetical protein
MFGANIFCCTMYPTWHELDFCKLGKGSLRGRQSRLLYDLVGRYEHHELHLMWESVNGRPPPNKISKAVLTRWWWVVNVAAQHLKDYWNQWLALSKAALNNTTGNTAAGKIAPSISISLMSEEKLRCDLHFMVAFSKSYFIRHMTWLQCIDERSAERVRGQPEMLQAIDRFLPANATGRDSQSLNLLRLPY